MPRLSDRTEQLCQELQDDIADLRNALPEAAITRDVLAAIARMEERIAAFDHGAA